MNIGMNSENIEKYHEPFDEMLAKEEANRSQIKAQHLQSYAKILRKTTNFLSLKDMFRQNFCHPQLNE